MIAAETTRRGPLEGEQAPPLRSAAELRVLWLHALASEADAVDDAVWTKALSTGEAGSHRRDLGQERDWVLEFDWEQKLLL